MLSNYPPGVTGSEFEIAGPDFEGYEVHECECGWEGEVLAEYYRGCGQWDCPGCGAFYETF